MKDQLFNRKILFSLLTVVTCLGFTAMSYGAAVVSVDPATVESPAVGEQLMVNINIAGGEGVAGYQVDVTLIRPRSVMLQAQTQITYLQARLESQLNYPMQVTKLHSPQLCYWCYI